MQKNHKKLFLFLVFVLFILYPVALYFALFASPQDYLHGHFVRIMYVHVSSAWLSILIYCLMGFFSFLCLLFNSSFVGICAYAMAPIGITFTCVCLVTGSLWGKPIWGAFWVWDARLTSMLVLLILYIGYYMVWQYTAFKIKIASVVNLLGLVNIPIIKFSVEIWSTLHQKSSFIRSGGVAMDSAMVLPLLLMFFASSITGFILWYFNLKFLMNAKKIEKIMIKKGITQAS